MIVATMTSSEIFNLMEKDLDRIGSPAKACGDKILNMLLKPHTYAGDPLLLGFIN